MPVHLSAIIANLRDDKKSTINVKNVDTKISRRIVEQHPNEDMYFPFSINALESEINRTCLLLSSCHTTKHSSLGNKISHEVDAEKEY
tara:strand:- start:90 stop:353 length:264 start_codon:yes stop_codon:yes gene_type:complete